MSVWHIFLCKYNMCGNLNLMSIKPKLFLGNPLVDASSHTLRHSKCSLNINTSVLNLLRGSIPKVHTFLSSTEAYNRRLIEFSKTIGTIFILHTFKEQWNTSANQRACLFCCSQSQDPLRGQRGGVGGDGGEGSAVLLEQLWWGGDASHSPFPRAPLYAVDILFGTIII